MTLWFWIHGAGLFSDNLTSHPQHTCLQMGTWPWLGMDKTTGCVLAHFRLWDLTYTKIVVAMPL